MAADLGALYERTVISKTLQTDNEASIRLHKKLGFDCVERYATERGKEVFVFEKQLDGNQVIMMDKKRILIIDDDIQIGNLEQEVLEKNGYICSRAYSGTEALLFLEKEKPDLILLDLMLPGLAGEEVIKQIHHIPVIVVSAKVSVDDKVSLLLGGAQDYLTKPFSTKELLARIEVQLRKTDTFPSDRITAGDITVDQSAHAVFVLGHQVALTKAEYAILKLLAQNPGQVIAKTVILDRISEDTLDCTESSLKTHISHLRAKMREASGKDYIESIWGIGFKLSME